MRILGCALVAVAVLLGLAPIAIAADSVDGVPASLAVGHQSQPQSEVSVLAVSLTAGAAAAAAGSGVAQVVARRRAVTRATRASAGGEAVSTH